jgi:hypothetical protein
MPKAFLRGIPAFALVPVWMYELELGIVHLKFRGLNSALDGYGIRV